MCKGGGGGDGGAAAREAERQKQIQAGYENIKKIFDGTTRGINQVDAPVEGQKYYDETGQELTFQIPGLPNAPVRSNMTNTIGAMSYNTQVQNYNKAIAERDAYLKKPLFSGVETTPGFDQAFYDARAQEYQDFANPQLEDQFSEAAKKLTLQLARAGILDSSARANQFSKLQRDYQLQKTGIVDKANDYANQARNNVEGARTELVNMNSAMADPALIATEAQNRMAALKASPSFDILAPLFTNVGEGIATQADLERRQAQRYNTGMFTPSYSGSGSSRSVR